MAAPLPSLNGLRAFEAAARHLSFKQAAQALFVTPGAVSQQVRALEDELGVALFRRRNRGIALTPAGEALYPVVREAFSRIAAAVDDVREHDRAGPLTVSVLASFAAKWLVPRLGRFRARHPEIDVRLSATNELVDFARDDVDMAIRLGGGRYPGLHAVHLLDDAVFPVCSPLLMQGPHPLRRPADLRHHTLLHDESPEDWRVWLRHHDVSGVDPERGPVFNDAAMALQVAIAGQGVAMSRRVLVADDLAAGRLVKPFDLDLPYQLAYYVVCPEATAQRPKVAHFREWLLAEARGEATV